VIPEVVTISPLIGASLSAGVACALLLLLWVYRRRAFILLWAAGWALAAIGLLFETPSDAAGASGIVVLAAISATGIGSAAAFLFGVFRFSGPLAWRRDALMLIVAIAVVAIAAGLLSFGTWHGLLLGSIAALHARTAWRAGIVGRKHRLAGGYTLAAALGAAAVTDLVGIVPSAGGAAGAFARVIVLGHAGAYVVVALGQHLFVFEDMLLELRDSNHELLAARAELHHAAITDPLTGLYNRRLFGEVSVHHLEHHRRFGLPLSLIYIDVDRFKYINDTLGHDVGDRALAHVGHYIRRQVREADYVFRLGGDEFVVLISCNGDEAMRRALKLQASFPATLAEAKLPDILGLSVGVAEVKKDAHDLDRAVQEADAKMYEDKRQRGRIPA
jgi:diguanylate cyclase (GGDEF)-like protein